MFAWSWSRVLLGWQVEHESCPACTRRLACHSSASPGSIGFMPWEMRVSALLVFGMWQSSHAAPGMYSPASATSIMTLAVQGLPLRVARAAADARSACGL